MGSGERGMGSGERGMGEWRTRHGEWRTRDGGKFIVCHQECKLRTQPPALCTSTRSTSAVLQCGMRSINKLSREPLSQSTNHCEAFKNVFNTALHTSIVYI